MIAETLKHSVMITGFVLVMMLVIEYLNVLTSGRWDRALGQWRWGQCPLASFLGATPGCLGAYAVASLYMHRVATFGALLAAMVATCGDEAYVMMALFPRDALRLFWWLFVAGVASGVAADFLLRGRRTGPTPHLAEYAAGHAADERCVPFSRREILTQWRNCTAHRGWLAGFLALFLLGVITGDMGHRHLGVELPGTAPGGGEVSSRAAPGPGPAGGGERAHGGEGGEGWDWVRVTLLVSGALGLLVVVSVPDHFLEEHLWGHLVRVHAWRILLWTFAAMLAVDLVLRRVNVETFVGHGRLPVLAAACLMGIIPQSGPHLVFTGLYAQGAIPFSVLLANSIVQDGHGMLPILAHSRRAFAAVKAVKLAIGFAVGMAGYLLGW